MSDDPQSRIFDYSVKTKRAGNMADIELTMFFHKTQLTSTRFAGCRSGTVSFYSDKIQVRTHTPSRHIDVTYELGGETGGTVEIAPNLKLQDAAGSSVEASLVTVTSSEKQSEATKFVGKEAPLQATVFPEDRGVTWTLAMTRGKKAVRDFLQTNERLEARAECPRPRVKVKFEGYAAGRVLTDSRFAELNLLQTIALWIKLFPDGIPPLRPARPKWRWV